MFALTFAIVSSTFSKVALHAQWRGYGARSPVFSVSFDSFSLRLFRQRKAAKWFCYQNGYNAFSFETIGPKEKALQKENAVFCAPAAQASAFEKAEQNNRLVPANIVRDKSQFVYLLLEIKLLFQRLIFAEKPLPRIM